MTEAYIGATSATKLELEWKLNLIHAKENLLIGGEYPRTELAENIFHSFGLLHIVAPFLPDVITTDFPVLEIAQKLTDAMYTSEGHRSPEWKVPSFESMGNYDFSSGNEATITYSGGKDSMWNLMYARQLGYDPLAVHINGLNKGVAKAEYQDVKKQQKAIGFPLLTIDFVNSPSQSGYIAMRSRDMLLTALAIPPALDYGANKIFLEGGFFAGAQEKNKAFSYRASTWNGYNRLLRQEGIPIEMVGTGRGEIESVKDLIEQQPDWLPLVSNCFSMPVFRSSIRNAFLKEAPTFSLYESQCGRCIKCRTVNLARVIYDPWFTGATDKKDILFFLEDTKRWLKSKHKEVEDIIDPQFGAILSNALELYA